MRDFSNFLFARPSFVEGIARLIDVGGSLNVYNTSPDGVTADTRALDADWRAVGDCVKESILRYARRLEKRSTQTEDNPSVQTISSAK